jgi:hypothetical protein
MNAEARLAQGAVWFYWVAALSMLNAVLAASAVDLRMVMGLGLTEILSALPQIANHHTALSPTEIAFILISNLVIAGIVAGFGFLSLKRQTWAFILGASLYLADAAILLFLQDWYSLAFHAYVLYKFYGGIKACFELKKPPAPAEGAA